MINANFHYSMITTENALTVFKNIVHLANHKNKVIAQNVYLDIFIIRMGLVLNNAFKINLIIKIIAFHALIKTPVSIAHHHKMVFVNYAPKTKL